jgi:hypothetical protein
MINPSNLYAEKIFSEHPIAMWALDDQVDYLSLIPEEEDSTDSKNNVFNWTITDGTKEQSEAIANEPFPEILTTTLNPILGISQTQTITATSPGIVSPLQMDASLETFSIGAYLFSNTPTVLSYEIGYTYAGLASPVLRKFDSQIFGRWVLISETFAIPQTAQQLQAVIKITHSRISGVTEAPEDYTFYVNGVTLGQWSEDFQAESSGVYGSNLPENVPFNYLAIPAKSYGLQDLDGYYFINNSGSLTAKNSGVPIVYGSSNVTRIFPNGNDPSLIIPGQGFLNEYGRYREYTVEMWARIDSKATTATRIFGPIGSTDGIYVDGPFIKLKIGDSIGAHPISEWYRPMLLDLKVIQNSASLLINGEQVIEISFLTNEIPLPQKRITQGGVEKDNDWLGFYASESVPFLDIDCVAIYSYLVPAIVAKRRFAYGQAVEFPENANSSYGGTSVQIDYAFADYTSNYSYPDIGRWSQGIIENLSIVDDALSVPDHKLPVAVFEDDSTTESWYQELYQQQNLSQQPLDPFISFTNKNGYLFFDTLNPIRQDVKGIFLSFKVSETSSLKQTLFKIEERNTTNYLECYIQNSSIYYKLNYNENLTTLYSGNFVITNKVLVAGIDIEKIIENFGQSAMVFFGNKDRLSLLLGGNRDFGNTFRGQIYQLGFCNEYSFSEMSGMFNGEGFLTYYNYEDYFLDPLSTTIYDAGDNVFQDDPVYSNTLDAGEPASFDSIAFGSIKEFTASYTLIPKINFNTISLDVAISGSWEDYQPLTYFAQYVSDIQDNKYYDLDFIQFNINYPALENFQGGKYDTSKNMVRAYVSFQYLKNNSSARKSYFSTAPANQNGTVFPGSEWVTTRYEVVDGTVIYLPKGIRITDISIVTHLEWTVPGIISNPLTIKKIQYASQAFNETNSNPVGTRFGLPVFPYMKYGLYFDYKSANPYRIYKESTPYLYLTKHSGIEKLGDYDAFLDRGFSIPVNKDLADDYKVIAMQAFLRYGKDKFPSEPEQIFEIESKNAYIKFYIVANDVTGQRARLYGINSKTGTFENGIAFYWNGKLVREPVVTLSDWGVLGISFSSILDFSSYVGGIRFTGSVLVNNVSQYQATNLQEIQRKTLRSWFLTEIISLGIEREWDFWNKAYTWNGVLVASQSNILGVDPADIYKTYVGTNKIIIDDDIPLKITGYEYNAYQGIAWQSRIFSAV